MSPPVQFPAGLCFINCIEPILAHSALPESFTNAWIIAHCPYAAFVIADRVNVEATLSPTDVVATSSVDFGAMFIPTELSLSAPNLIYPFAEAADTPALINKCSLLPPAVLIIFV